MLKYRPKSEKTPENTKNHTFLDLWVIVTPEIVLKLFIKFKLGLMKLAQPYFITNLDIGVQKCSKILKNSPKSEKTRENTKNHTFLALWVFGTPEIVLKLFIKLRPVLMKVVQPYFINIVGVEVQKCSKMLKYRPKSEKRPEKY